MKIRNSLLTVTMLAMVPGMAMSAEQDLGVMPGSPSELREGMGGMDTARGREEPTVREGREPQRPEVYGKEPGKGMTAQNQSSNPKYLEVTRSIRQKISERNDLSFSARNVKIITDDQGTVTLKGHVRDENEKQAVEQIAREAASPGMVNSELVVSKREESSKGERHG